MRLTIRILTVVIILLPLTELFFVSYATFVDLSNEWRTIRIKEGNHSYYPSVEFIYHLDETEFYFRPNDSWYYNEPERNGWNKIRGFSKGMHHDNASARLVYKCVDDTLLLIGSYCYVNGVHPNEGMGQQAILDTIRPNRVYHCLIRYEDEKFKFYFEDKYWECFAGENPSWGYMLNPFIGGVFTLDHDWSIDILDINRAEQAASLQSLEPNL
ncbi:MAG: hypothetical protein JW731_04800 [Bacteroidales bacterium]|nr:hypothetical protein [Bacteroidales bacterium]